MTEIDKIFQNSKVTHNEIKPYLKHQIFNTKYKPRENFKDLKQCYDDFYKHGAEPRMIALSGLRGTGKTTLLWQIADYANKSDMDNIYFFKVEKIIDLGYSILDIFWHIENNNKEFFYKKAVLLFDEVHIDPKWSSSLKIIYEDMRSAYIVVTGSSALLLQTTADLATRMLMLHTFPLQFSEYLSITKNIDIENRLQDNLKDALFYSENITELENKLNKLSGEITYYYNKLDNKEILIDNYIKYHNITRFSLHRNTNFILSELDSLYHRVIYEDIPTISKNIKPTNSKKILLRLAASDEINVQTLSQVIGIPQDEINEVIDILAKAELLNVLYPYGGIDSKLNKMKKAFFMSPSIRLALISHIENSIGKKYMAKFYEDIVVMYLRRFFDDALLSFASNKKSKNPDFVIETKNIPILIEVGINKKSTKQITRSKIQYRYGIIINTKTDDFKIEKDTVIIPLNWFLLL